MKNIFSLLGVAVLIGLTSCNDIDTIKLEEHQGAFILNKGTDKSNVSRYSYEHKNVSNNYFQSKNNSLEMGSGAHTMAIGKGAEYPKGKAFIVYPNNNKVSMVNMDMFTSAGHIEYTKPTDVLLAKDNRAYICATGEGNKGMVYDYDLKASKASVSFEVAQEPLKMIASGKYLYCASKGDGTGAKVIVIDMTTNTKVDTVSLAHDNPIDMAVDIDRNVWVYCAGENQALVKLVREFKTITLDKGTDKERRASDIINHPTNFVLGPKKDNSVNPLTISQDGRFLYYVYGALCKNTVYAENEVSKTSVVSGNYQSEAFNSVDFDPRTNSIMGLTAGGKLVILREKDKVWSDESVHDVGVNPLLTTFNY